MRRRRRWRSFSPAPGLNKGGIKDEISCRFGYDLDRRLNVIRPAYRFDVSCQGSVPESIIAFLGSNDYENAVRLAVSLGGDADIIACIVDGIAQAFYKEIQEEIVAGVRGRLPEEFLTIIDEFTRHFDL